MYSYHLWLGHEELDRQHDRLADAVIRFSQSTTTEAMTIAINDFFEIWREHIRFEEHIMMRTDFPFFGKHENSHFQITQELSQIFRNSISKGFINRDEVVSRMTCWFDEHFYEFDVALAEHLNAERLLIK